MENTQEQTTQEQVPAQQEPAKKKRGPRSFEEARAEVERRLDQPAPWTGWPTEFFQRADYKALQTMYKDMPFSQVLEWGKEVQVERKGETEQTYRMRVMYALQERLYRAHGSELPEKARINRANLEEQAKVEAQDMVASADRESKSMDKTLSRLIADMAKAGKPTEEIEEAAVTHPKYRGFPFKAKRYVKVYIKYMRDKGLLAVLLLLAIVGQGCSKLPSAPAGDTPTAGQYPTWGYHAFGSGLQGPATVVAYEESGAVTQVVRLPWDGSAENIAWGKVQVQVWGSGSPCQLGVSIVDTTTGQTFAVQLATGSGPTTATGKAYQ